MIFIEATIATIHPKNEAGIGNQNSHSGFFIFYIRNFPMTSFFRQEFSILAILIQDILEEQGNSK